MVQSGEFTGMTGGKHSEGVHAIDRLARRARAAARAPSTSACATGSSAASATGATPSPMIHCDECGVVPGARGRPARHACPMDIDHRRGRDAGKDSKEFYECTCPKCGKPAPRARPTPWTRSRAPRGTTCATPTRTTTPRRSTAPRSTTGCRSTSTSAASSTRSCTCSTAASWTKVAA